MEYGNEIVRTYQYNSDNIWTGIITELNGEVIEDEIEIGPAGQVKSYTSNGVRTEYIWKADNITKVKTYIQVTEVLSSVQKSLAFNQLGIDVVSKNKAKEHILSSFNKLQKINRTASALRGNHTEEWILVFVEEQTVDPKVIQPFTSAALGYPGTSSDGGYLILPKNFIVNFKGYNVNEDGSPGDLAYLYHFDSYTTKDNLPVDVKYSSFVADYELDEAGNYLDYREHGIVHYAYISGCNQKPN